MNLIILYQRRSRTALLGVALTALLLITHLQNNSPIRYRTLALFFAKAQQAEASRNAHQAEAGRRTHVMLGSHSEPPIVGYI